MIVEDDIDTGRLISLYLARSGFDTISFTEPLVALDHFKQYPRRYCLILLDMSMDDLSGIELSKALRKYNSQVKILLITGYSKEEISNGIEYNRAKISDVIQKPIELENWHFTSFNFVPKANSWVVTARSDNYMKS